MQLKAGEFKSEGATLVAISPQDVKNAKKAVEEFDLDFPVLSDPGNQYAKKLGIVYEFTDELKEAYKQIGIDLERANADSRWELPLPATYIVDKDGIIRWSFVDENYTHRAEPEDVLKEVKELT